MTIAALALPAAVASGPAPGCASVDLARFNEVQDEGALGGYPGWGLVTGQTFDRWPPTPTAVAVKGDVACDLTHGLTPFLAVRATPGTPSDAMDAALFAVHAVYLDVFPHPALASDVGLPAAPSVVTKLAHGYAVDFTLWTARNGLVARFHVVLDGNVEARFTVLDVAKGPAFFETEGWILKPGSTDASMGPIAEASVTTFANADGSSWRVTYNPASYANAAEAASYVAMTGRFAQEVYASETAPWGFASADPDRVLDITLDGCDCIYGSFDANIHLFPKPNDILPLVPGLAYPDSEENVGGLILGHEFFHHLEYSINQWHMGGWQVEGQARFSETVHAPDTDFGPNTLLFRTDANGLNDYILHPNTALAGRSYGYQVSLLWGWLYAHDGGMAVIKRELQETVTGGTGADTDGIQSINRAISAMPSHEHADAAHALDAMAVAEITHEGWTWGKIDGTHAHDWSTFFVPVPRASPRPSTGQPSVETLLTLLPATSVGARQTTVAADGFDCVNAKPVTGGVVAAVAQFGALVHPHVLTKAAGVWSDSDVNPNALVQGAEDGVICFTRSNVATGPAPALAASSTSQYTLVVGAV